MEIISPLVYATQRMLEAGTKKYLSQRRDGLPKYGECGTIYLIKETRRAVASLREIHKAFVRGFQLYNPPLMEIISPLVYATQRMLEAGTKKYLSQRRDGLPKYGECGTIYLIKETRRVFASLREI